MKPKSFVTIALLVFVAVSVIFLIVNQVGNGTTAAISPKDNTSPEFDDKVIVYYFHGNSRCVTCRTIEAYAKEAVEASFADQLSAGKMEFKVINVETPNTVHFIQDYQLYAPTVVVARFENNSQLDWKNLDKVWNLVSDKRAFMSYIESETAALLHGGA
ncbi:MAG TPA: nitrophenyl compound nitroreductase subunit ArsF family protein [Bellilinea sp.]|nr:nitrophenyl compound nitroreductase subunit ArsF family protein [Bellilinea sp.]